MHFGMIENTKCLTMSYGDSCFFLFRETSHIDIFSYFC